MDADTDPSVLEVYPLGRIDDKSTTVELLGCELETSDAPEPNVLEATPLKLGREEAKTIELPNCEFEMILVEVNELK